MMVNSQIAGQPAGVFADKPVGPANPCGILVAAWKASM